MKPGDIVLLAIIALGLLWIGASIVRGIRRRKARGECWDHHTHFQREGRITGVPRCKLPYVIAYLSACCRCPYTEWRYSGEVVKAAVEVASARRIA